MVQALGNDENASQFRVLFDFLKKLVHIQYFIFFSQLLGKGSQIFTLSRLKTCLALRTKTLGTRRSEHIKSRVPTF